MRGNAVGSGEGVNGDGVTRGDRLTSGDCDRAGGLPAHAARSVVRAIARIPNPPLTRRCSALEIGFTSCDIAHVIRTTGAKGSCWRWGRRARCASTSGSPRWTCSSQRMYGTDTDCPGWESISRATPWRARRSGRHSRSERADHEESPDQHDHGNQRAQHRPEPRPGARDRPDGPRSN
jgi:hypothetical protein